MCEGRTAGAIVESRVGNTTPGTKHKKVRVSREGRKPVGTGGGTNTWTYEVDNAESKLSRVMHGLEHEVLISRNPGMGESDSITEDIKSDRRKCHRIIGTILAMES